MVTKLTDEELRDVSGGANKGGFPSKKFKCLSPNCGATVIGNTFDGEHYEGTCQACGKLWDYSIDEAIR